MNKVVVHSSFVLKSGANFTYADLLLEICLSDDTIIYIDNLLQNADKDLIEDIRRNCLRWIKWYSDSGVYLSVKIKNISCFLEGEFDVARGVDNAFHEALPQLGITPPQIFDL